MEMHWLLLVYFSQAVIFAHLSTVFMYIVIAIINCLFVIHPPHFNAVAALPCEMQMS